jgi:hypothetical protein
MVKVTLCCGVQSEFVVDALLSSLSLGSVVLGPESSDSRNLKRRQLSGRIARSCQTSAGEIITNR